MTKTPEDGKPDLPGEFSEDLQRHLGEPIKKSSTEEGLGINLDTFGVDSSLNAPLSRSDIDLDLDNPNITFLFVLKFLSPNKLLAE